MPGSEIAHADSPYPVLPYGAAADADAPPLPADSGGIAVHTECSRGALRYTLAPMVGVDGRPAVHGWGDALIVVPPGERLVEVQYVEPMQSTMVTVAAGEVVAVEYFAAGDGASPGSLGRRGEARRSRSVNLLAYVGLIIAMVVVFDVGVYLLNHPAGLGVGVSGLVAAVVVLLAGGLAARAIYRYQHGTLASPAARRSPARRRPGAR